MRLKGTPPAPLPTTEPERDYREPLFAVFFLGIAGIGLHMVKYNNDTNGYYVIALGVLVAGGLAIKNIRGR